MSKGWIERSGNKGELWGENYGIVRKERGMRKSAEGNRK